jgi:arsenical pump membrane protein
MIIVLILSLLAIIAMFVCIIKYPVIRIKNMTIDTFFLPLLVVALILIIFNLFDKTDFLHTITTSSSVNPVTILILFICVSLLSIALDETGFFAYIANIFVNKYKKSQYQLFVIIYFLISILTVFTSNDIVILTFTPFILYFSKRAKINPIPYLVMEFVAANTYSVILPIGNPTNIYLTSLFNIDFMSYVKVMLVPALIVGISSFTALFLLFRKDLGKKMENFEIEGVEIKNKPLCIISLIHLFVTTILLAVSSYVNLEMWVICLLFAISLTLFLLGFSIYYKNFNYLTNTLRRLPYNLIPFILSMFTIIMALDSYDIFLNIYNLLNKINNSYLQKLIYLLASTLSCNVINNIPMTLAFGSILSNTNNLSLVYVSIIGSNIGSLLTPIGALAGIMWIRILKYNNVDYSFTKFMKNGFIITLFIISALSIVIIFL